MANAELFAFNRGLISKLALARTDLTRTSLSAEIQTNFMPMVLGAMMLRAGTEYLGQSASNNQSIDIPFVFSTTDTARLELTDSVLRVWVDDALISRDSVATAITNGTFDSDIASWTDDDDSGATSAWKTGGYMSLVGTDFAAARRYQEVTVAGGDQNTIHGLRIVIERGPITFRVGSTQGGDEYLEETALGTGTHSLAFTPTGNFFIEFESYTQYESLLDSVAVEASGTVTLPTPWAEADLPLIRHIQSADVVFVSADGYKQRRIERRGTTSWSIIEYDTKDGPFRLVNVGPVTITPSDINGDITLTASAPLFKSTNVGCLWEITSIGQKVEADFTAEDQQGGHIRVVGSGSQRQFSIARAGTWTATVTLQRSVSEPGSWVDVTTYSSNGTSNYNDSLTDQIIYYRLVVKTGDYTSGTVETELEYANGGLTGVVRLTAVASATSASALVLTALGGTDGSTNWREGDWSDRRGWPSAVYLYEGRLFWFGKGKIWGSVSDAYDSFDSEVEGDSGPINRQIGFGPVDRINWAIGIHRLLVGGQSSEYSIRSNSFDEPLTPTSFNIKDPSTQGSADVPAVKVDAGAVFVHRSKTNVFELSFSLDDSDYTSRDITIHVPEVVAAQVTRIAVQRQPDTRIHCVLADGRVAVCLYNKAEDVVAWILVDNGGIVEEISVLPGIEEDAVYYTTQRLVDSSVKRYYEKWALQSEVHVFTTVYSGASASVIPLTTDDGANLYANGTVVTVRDSDGAKVENLTVTAGAITLSSPATYAHVTPAITKLGDSFLVYSGAATSTITGLGYLEGETVGVFGDGKYQGTFTVASGQITGIPETVEEAVVGLPYTAWFKSTKLAYADRTGASLSQVKRVTQLGLVLGNTHHQGLEFGSNFDTMYDLAEIPGNAVPGTIHAESDERMINFPGEYDTDTRICLRATAPKPCTVLAAVIGFEKTNRS